MLKTGQLAENVTGGTVPTVGVDLHTTKVKGMRHKVELREVGGSMVSLWRQYLSRSNLLMYVVDASTPSSVGNSVMDLLDCLAQPGMEHKSVLLVFNKRDLPCGMPRAELESVFQLDFLYNARPGKLYTTEVSAFDGTGLSVIVEWIIEHGMEGVDDTVS